MPGPLPCSRPAPSGRRAREPGPDTATKHRGDNNPPPPRARHPRGIAFPPTIPNAPGKMPGPLPCSRPAPSGRRARAPSRHGDRAPWRQRLSFPPCILAGRTPLRVLTPVAGGPPPIDAAQTSDAEGQNRVGQSRTLDRRGRNRIHGALPVIAGLRTASTELYPVIAEIGPSH